MSTPRPIVPMDEIALALERVRLGALVVVAAARWAELPSSRGRRDALLEAAERFERAAGISDD